MGFNQAPRLDLELHGSLEEWSDPSLGPHTVQFYSDESFFIDSLSCFIATALGAGNSAVVIATEAHRCELARVLKNRGLDLPMVASQGRFTEFDAETALRQFMRNGWPDAGLFSGYFGAAVDRANLAAVAKSPRAALFGEMVALLWRQGKPDAAIQLEQLWNDLATKHSFSLRCAYPLGEFNRDVHGAPLQEICSHHSHVIPAESYITAAGQQERLRSVAVLQQKAVALDAAVAERRRAQDFTRQIVESITDCIKVLDLDGKVLFINGQGCAAMGLTGPNAVVGTHYADLWSGEEHDAARHAVRSAAENGIGTLEACTYSASGERTWWDVVITPLRDERGAPERLLAVSRNITDRKRSHEALIRSEKLASAGKMAAIIAHEINNPLAAVTNLLYLAAQSQSNPMQYIAYAEREIARVAEITRRTLAFYRDSSYPEAADLWQLVDEVIFVHEANARVRSVRLVAVKPDVTSPVEGCKGELRQVLSNLVVNAIEATPDGGSVEITSRTESEHLLLSVWNSGPGIAPDHRPHIFEPFFTTKATGTGLGLWVSTELARKHGGDILLSTGEDGTTFTLVLPLKQGNISAA